MVLKPKTRGVPETMRVRYGYGSPFRPRWLLCYAKKQQTAAAFLGGPGAAGFQLYLYASYNLTNSIQAAYKWDIAKVVGPVMSTLDLQVEQDASMKMPAALSEGGCPSAKLVS